MNKKIILITGSDSGIGKQTALTLAKAGHQIIVHGRNEQKVRNACGDIIDQSNNSNVDFVIGDLSSMTEVKQIADIVKQKYNYLDALINNAGTQMGKNRVETDEGHERTMATNVFAPLLLSESLISLLQKSNDGRIVTISSGAYKLGTSDKYLDDIELTNNYSFSKAYGLSKLYVLWVMWHLKDNLQYKNINNITINCMEPGSVTTNLGSESKTNRSIFYKIVLFFFMPFTQNPLVPGKTSAALATSNKYKGVNGEFFNKKGELEKENKKYYSKTNDQKLWNYCMKIISSYLPK